MTPRVEMALALAGRCPHDFTIQYPPPREYFRKHFRCAPEANCSFREQRMLLYVHIPFCEARCSYCNFAIDIRDSASLHRTYVDALHIQLDRRWQSLVVS